MEPAAIRVILRGESRWSVVLTDELAEYGISCVPYARAAGALRRLDLRGFVAGLRAHVVHQVFAGIKLNRFLLRARVLGQRIVMHWIGSDVLNLRVYRLTHGRLPELHTRYVDVHLADSPQIQRELAHLGLDSTVVRLLPKLIAAEVEPLPAEPAVISYWSDARPEFYGSTMYCNLARRFPHITFYVAGATGAGIPDPPTNMVFLGEVKDMDAVYRRATALFRVVEHDSLSAMVLEAMARGRYVLYCYEFPHTTYVTRFEDAVSALGAILQRRDPDEAAASYVRENFSWRREIERLIQVYRGLLAGGGRGRAPSAPTNG